VGLGAVVQVGVGDGGLVGDAGATVGVGVVPDVVNTVVEMAAAVSSRGLRSEGAAAGTVGRPVWVGSGLGEGLGEGLYEGLGEGLYEGLGSGLEV
jgi:hypothetical protein